MTGESVNVLTRKRRIPRGDRLARTIVNINHDLCRRAGLVRAPFLDRLFEDALPGKITLGWLQGREWLAHAVQTAYTIDFLADVFLPIISNL
jgi:hypothetical protein